MKYLPYLLLLLLFACKKENVSPTDPQITQTGNPDCTEQGCGFLNAYGLGVTREDGALNLSFGNNSFLINTPRKICSPDAIDLYQSEDNVDFRKIERLSPDNFSYRIENLDNDIMYYFKIVSLHCELDSVISKTIAIKPGESSLPDFSGKELPAGAERFQISNDNQSVIYRTTSDYWYITDWNNPIAGQQIFGRSFDARWLNDNTKIAYVELLKQDNYLRSHKLNIYDSATQLTENLHTILNPEEYWIHNIKPSSNGKSIFFASNKDNGFSTSKEQKVYDNLWRIDLDTKVLTQLSDFLPIDFDVRDFKEDPLSPNNFYLLGGPYVDFSSERKFDLYYYNTTDRSLTPILEDEFQESFIEVSPSGDKILFSSNRTGNDELWIYNLTTENLTQITDKHLYGTNSSWRNTIWKDNNTLLTYIFYNEEWKFGEFEVE